MINKARSRNGQEVHKKQPNPKSSYLPNLVLNNNNSLTVKCFYDRESSHNKFKYQFLKIEYLK